MKNIISIFIALFSVTFLVSAQEDLQVLITGMPDKIEIVPKVFEFHGKIAGTLDPASVITTNEKLVDEIIAATKAGKKISLTGFKLDSLILNRIVNNYSDQRIEFEVKLQQFIEQEKSRDDPDMTRIAQLEKEFARQQANTKRYIEQIKRIKERSKNECIYLYSWKVIASEKASTPQGDDGLQFGGD